MEAWRYHRTQLTLSHDRMINAEGPGWPFCMRKLSKHTVYNLLMWVKITKKTLYIYYTIYIYIYIHVKVCTHAMKVHASLNCCVTLPLIIWRIKAEMFDPHTLHVWYFSHWSWFNKTIWYVYVSCAQEIHVYHQHAL